MADNRAALATAGIGAVLVAICCAAPLLIAVFGTVGVIAWITNAAYVLVPVLLTLLGVVGITLYRRTIKARAGSKSRLHRKVENHE